MAATKIDRAKGVHWSLGVAGDSEVKMAGAGVKVGGGVAGDPWRQFYSHSS